MIEDMTYVITKIAMLASILLTWAWCHKEILELPLTS